VDAAIRPALSGTREPAWGVAGPSSQGRKKKKRERGTSLHFCLREGKGDTVDRPRATVRRAEKKKKEGRGLPPRRGKP